MVNNNNLNSSPALPTTTDSHGGLAPFISSLSAPQHQHKLDYRKSPLLMIASVIAILNIIVMLVAFGSASWIVTYADLGAYGTKSQQIGLWQYCFNSSHRYSFRDARKKVSTQEGVTPASDALAELIKREPVRPLSGCRWWWQFEFWYLKDFMQPPFFVAGQILFTFALVLTLAIGWSVVKLWRHRYVGREPHVAVALCISSAASGFCTLATLIVFALSVYEGNWLNEWAIRTISWSYGVAAAGLILSFCVSVLFGWLAHWLQVRAVGISPAYAEKVNPRINGDSSNVQLLRYKESDFVANEQA